MARKAYILTFDRDDEINYKKFHKNLKVRRGFRTEPIILFPLTLLQQ